MSIHLFRRPSKRTAAYTFVEVMIAALLLGTSILSVLVITSHSAQIVSDSRHVTYSSQLLHDKMEQIRTLTWGNLGTLSSFVDTNDPSTTYSGTITQAVYDSYKGTTTVINVTVAVAWTNQNGRVSSNSLSTVITRGGLSTYFR